MTELSPSGTVAAARSRRRARRICPAGPRSASTCCSPMPRARRCRSSAASKGICACAAPRSSSAISARSTAPPTPTAGFRPATWRASMPTATSIITGRAKDLIKSGGEWINPAEIEAVVGALPEVSLAAVIGRPHPKWGERPILLVETRDSAADQRRGLAGAAARQGRALVDSRRGHPRAAHAAGADGQDRQDALEDGIWRRRERSDGRRCRSRDWQARSKAAPASDQGAAARREDGADPRRGRVSVLQARPVRRHAEGRRQARRRAPHAAQLLLRRQEEAVRRRVRAPRGGHQHAADGGARRLRRGDQGQADRRRRAARLPRHRPRSLHPGRRGLEELRRARRAGGQHARVGRRADGRAFRSGGAAADRAAEEGAARLRRGGHLLGLSLRDRRADAHARAHRPHRQAVGRPAASRRISPR